MTASLTVSNVNYEQLNGSALGQPDARLTQGFLGRLGDTLGRLGGALGCLGVALGCTWGTLGCLAICWDDLVMISL